MGILHKWSKDDDLVAFYLYKFGDNHLSLKRRDIGKILGMGYGSLIMRISNFKSIDRESKGLDHFAKQSMEIYTKYKHLPEDELIQKVNAILKKHNT